MTLQEPVDDKPIEASLGISHGWTVTRLRNAAIDPKWLIYLPPTMSPCETSKEPSLLEHPQEAFSYYRHEGVPHIVCEQKQPRQ
jgi:hypothetical protein